MRTRTLLGLVFGAVIAISVGRSIWSVVRIDESVGRYETIVREHEHAQRALRDVQAIAIDMETGVRGFELTGSNDFLGPYERGARALSPALTELAAVEVWGHAGSAQAAALERELREWDREIARPVVEGRAEGSDLLATRIDGRRRMQAIRGHLDALDRALTEIRASEGTTFRALRDEQSGQTALLAGATVLVLVLLGWITVRAIDAPLLRLVGYAEQVGRRVHQPIDSAGLDEVRSLTTAMSAMSERIERERDREVAFGELVGALAASRSIDEVASVALRSLVAQTRSKGGCLLVQREGAFVVAAAAGVSPGQIGDAARGLCEDVARSGEPSRLELAPGDERFVVRSASIDVTPRLVLAVPLSSGRRIVGVIELLDPAEGDIATELDRVASRVALALENAIAAHEAEELRAELAASNEELQSQNEELRAQEEELRAQSELLQRSQEQIGTRNLDLERATRAKSDFLASMSHELRTPLNAVIGFSELLTSGSESRMSERERRFAKDIHAAGTQLLRLVNDVLDLAKIEAGALAVEVEEVDLRAQMVAARTLLEPVAARRRVAIEVTPGGEALSCVADPSRVRQVLVNLVSNAVKFSPEGGEVRVCATVDAHEVRVEVRDHGAGIAESDVGRLFQPFSQLASGRAVGGGAGLGLSIVRELVDRMGGRTGVESKIGEGSTFWFTLPRTGAAAVAARARADASVVAAADAPRPVAIVVEDVAEDARVLEDVLSRGGYDVTVFRSAEAALRGLEGVSAGLVVVDLGLPGMPGHVLIPRLRALDTLRRAPIVALTARRIGDSERAELSRAGATMVAEKGVMTGAGFLEQLTSHVRARSIEPPREARVRVLVVDDVDANRRVAREMLGAPRFDVIDVAGAREALELVAREHFDVVLMDIQMPGMDGLDATRAIRAAERTRTLPVIALTAQAMVGDRERAIAAGCVGYVAKPVGRSELIGAIDAALAHGRVPDADLRRT